MTTYEAKAPSKRTDQMGNRPKRFWKEVVIATDAIGFGVKLDGRPIKTPKSLNLTLPTFGLAGLVAREWEAVTEYVDYSDMPLTRLSFASLDHMAEPEPVVAEALKYAQTDLVCYPSPYPQALKDREAAEWGPALDWVEQTLGLRFIQNQSLLHMPQPLETIDGLKALIEALSVYERAGLMAAIPLFGSVVLALNVHGGHVSGEAALKASRLGEAFQAQTWGEDAESQMRLTAMTLDAKALEVWFQGLK
jgi:chaperone required for assembly of F1-ATPase